MSESPLPATIEPQNAASSVTGSSAPGPSYTVQEAAAILNLPTTWIYARTRKDEIPFGRFGKYIRFTDGQLKAIIASGATNRKTVTKRGA